MATVRLASEGFVQSAVASSVPTSGTTGYVLTKTAGGTAWQEPQAGGTTDYNELENKPQIGGTTLTGNKTLDQLGIMSSSVTHLSGDIATSDSRVNGWNTAANEAHTHNNKSTLDGIDSSKVSEWNGKVSHSEFSSVTSVGDRYTLSDIKGKVNEVLNILKGIASIALMLGAFWAHGAIETQTARLDSLYNDSLVVTNVTGSGLSTNDVCAIVTNNVGGVDWVTNITATSGGKEVTLLNVKWGYGENPDEWMMNLNVPGIGEAWRPCGSPNNTDPNATMLAASEYPELVTTRGIRNALGLAYWTDTTNAIATATPDLSSRATFAEVTNIVESAAVTNAGAVAYADGLAEEKRDLTNNVCVATTFTDWIANLEAGARIDDYNGITFSDNKWSCFVYGPDWVAQFSANGTVGSLSLTFTDDWGLGKSFTATRSIKALSNDVFTTYSVMTSAVANVKIDTSTLAQKAEVAAVSNTVSQWEDYWAKGQTATNIVNGLLVTSNEDFVRGVTNVVDAAVLAMVADNANTNAIAILNEINGQDWTTYGGGFAGLLAAILAAIAWLKKKKVGTLKVGSDVSVSTVTNGEMDVSTLFSSANTSLVGEINYTIGDTGNPADHTVRTLGTLETATTLTIAAPRKSGALRDFAITFTEPSTAVGVTFSTTDAASNALTFYGEFLTPAASKTYVYYLTEIASNTFLVKGEEIATVTPPTI